MFSLQGLNIFRKNSSILKVVPNIFKNKQDYVVTYRFLTVEYLGKLGFKNLTEKFPAGALEMIFEKKKTSKKDKKEIKILIDPFVVTFKTMKIETKNVWDKIKIQSLSRVSDYIVLDGSSVSVELIQSFGLKIVRKDGTEDHWVPSKPGFLKNMISEIYA